MAVCSPGRARSSWLRELIRSLAKTLPRWYWARLDAQSPGLLVWQAQHLQLRQPQELFARLASGEDQPH